MADAFGIPDDVNRMPFGAGSPAEEGARTGGVGTFLAGLGSGVLKGLFDTVAGPGRLAQPNPYPDGSEGWHWYEGQREQGGLNWANHTALNMIGGAPAVSGVSKAGEVAMGIVPVDAGRAFGIPARLPEAETFTSAVKNTPGARIEDGALVMKVKRSQSPEQELEPSVRGGVFYQPGGPGGFSYTGKNGYGGAQSIEGETAIKAPLFVKGATGGKAPEAAFDQLAGKKGAYQDMRTDALKSMGWGSPKEEAVSAFLEKYAPELAPNAYDIIRSSRQGNQLAYALQEAAVASAARRAGHDAVIGYSTKRGPGKDPFISEVFDVRESHYPGASGEFETWPADMFGSSVGKLAK